MDNPIQNFANSAINGFQNPDKALQGEQGPMNQFLNTIPGLKNIRGMNAGAFGQQAVTHPQIAFGGEMEMAPEDINAVMPSIERHFQANDTSKPLDPNYYMSGQQKGDEFLIRNAAHNHLGPDVAKSPDLNGIVKSLWQKVLQARTNIPR